MDVPDEDTLNTEPVWLALVAPRLNRLPVVNEVLPSVNGLVVVAEFQFHTWAYVVLSILLVAVAAVKPLIAVDALAVLPAGDNQLLPSHTKLAVLLTAIVNPPTLTGKVDALEFTILNTRPAVAFVGFDNVMVPATDVCVILIPE